MYFLQRPDTETYLTIHREDEQNFYDIINSSVFSKENKFRLIKNKEEIKKILEDRYASKNRGSEYTAGLPSATLVSSALFPYNLDKGARHNQIGLLRWHNDIDVQDLQGQKITNKLSTDIGSYIHKILELCCADKETRIFTKIKSLNKYIELANTDKEILSIIDNFEDKQENFIQIANKILTPFFESELKYIDPIFNEIFLKNEYLQGCIDGVFYYKNKLYIYDWKTSKKSNSYKQIYEKYARQLYIYSRMLLRNKIITKKEYDNLGFKIGFFNWNSGKFAIYEYDKKEIDKNSAYVNFILSWYWSMRNGEDIKIVL